MDLEELFLKKEELPIFHKNCFQIPLHPRLLEPSIKIDETIAQKVFPEVAQEWYEELKKYSAEDNQEKEWINSVFLKEKPIIEKYYNHQMILGFWQDEVNFRENGFVTCFSINRNAGGSLYFNSGDMNCETAIPGYYIKFSKEKAKEFEFENFRDNSRCLVYGSHNIDHYPAALFLRNWAIKYMNEVFKQVF